MNRLLRGAAAVWLIFAAMFALAETEAEKAHDATLMLMNREVVVLRMDLAGVSPATRVERARKRFYAIDDDALRHPVSAVPFTLGEAHGYQLVMGNQLLFSLMQGDRDPESNEAFDTLVRQTEAHLEEVRLARLEQHYWPSVLQAASRAVLASVALLGSLWLLARWARRAIVYLECARDRTAPHRVVGRVPWSEYLFGLLVRLSHLLWLLLVVLFLYVWVTYVLRCFPLTRPLGDRLGHFTQSAASWAASGFIGAIPGVITVILVLFLTRAMVSVLNLFFSNVQSGRVQVPFLHAETTSATRRIVIAVVWGLGIAIAYPFIPGSSSEAFKGLSVLFGIVISLGSTSVVTQMMSGLVIVYSRAVRKNDYVAVGGVEGLITEIGTLATKIVTVRNEVVTVPNAVLISKPIHNYSRLGDSECAMLSVRISIGYDVSWRQVRAMLLAGAARCTGLRAHPAPFVYQRALNDFHVDYELFTCIERPPQRNTVLSELVGHVLDVFNENGVQIMSPHFQLQPPRSVLAEPWSGRLAGEDVTGQG